MEKILIKNDVFNIANRLKQINKNYFILYNKNTKKFEVHFKNLKSTLQLIIPYKFLDKRTVDLVQKSRIENNKKLLKELEEHNYKLEQNKTKKLQQELNFKVTETLNYIKKYI